MGRGYWTRNRRFAAGGQNRVNSVAFSSDGRFVLTGGKDGIAYLWNAGSGEQVRRFLGHLDEIYAVAISPNGRFVLTGSKDNTARLCDIATGQEIHRFKSEGVYSVAFDPSGQYVAIGTLRRTILSDVTTGKQVQEYRGESETGWLGRVGFSIDGRLLFASGLWDGSQGKEVLRFGEASPAVLSPDGLFFLKASPPDGLFFLKARPDNPDNTAHMLDVFTGQEIRRFKGHSGRISALSFSSDGRLVLTGGEDKTARLWNADTGEEIHRFGELTREVTDVAISHDNRFVLARGE